MKAQTIDDSSRKPYNNEPLRDGEVLVPQLVDDREYAIALGAKPENFRRWTKGGVSFTVMFVPVPAEQEVLCRQAFNAAVNELLDDKLGPNRFSRCLIPQPDGSRKLCPKMQDGHYRRCATCPHRGEYEREDRSLLSIEAMEEEHFHPMNALPSAETEALEEVLFDDLVDYLKDIHPALAEVVTLGFEGFERKEIVKRLPVQSSQAYDLYAKARKLTREFLRD